MGEPESESVPPALHRFAGSRIKPPGRARWSDRSEFRQVQSPHTHRHTDTKHAQGGTTAGQRARRIRGRPGFAEPIAHAHRKHTCTHHGTADGADTQRRTPVSEHQPPQCMTPGCREGQTTVARAAISAEGTPHSAAHSPASRSPRPRATKAQPGSKAGQPCGEEACAGKGTAAKQKTKQGQAKQGESHRQQQPSRTGFLGAFPLG